LQARVNVVGRMIAWGGQPVGVSVRAGLLVGGAGLGVSLILSVAGPLKVTTPAG
jgi:hypothetical protein